MEEKLLTQESIVTKEQYEAAHEVVLKKLQNELAAHLTYHNAQHTLNVLEATTHLIETEKVPAPDHWLLLTAALFHDTGFLKNYKNHEEHSCEVAKEILPGFGYTPGVIDRICNLIMATKLPQSPSDHLQQII